CLTLLVLAVMPLLIWKVWSVVSSQWSVVSRNILWVMLLVLGAVLSSCAPPSRFNAAPLQSQLFDQVQIIGSRGVGVGQLNKPRSVAVDLHDNVFVVDMTGRVQQFSPNGTFLLSWQMPQTDLGKPKGMCRDREGNIVLVEPHYQRVNYFSPEGKLL